ncbi:MAG: aspartyl/asparaginyl beta-hydroxylase domain-containing protein [Sphingomonadales bacterium]
MPTVREKKEPGFLDQLRRVRRQTIKIGGMKLIRALAGFLGAQSKVGNTPLLDTGHFSFLPAFIENWPMIRDEVKEILKYREAVPPFQKVSTDQMRIAKDDNWRTFVLFALGTKMAKNCRHAPVTTKLLEQVPDLQTAWFSILAPGYHIPAHRGVTKGIVRAHLGLLVPVDQDKCRMRVDTEICVWRPGEIFVFDDTYEHEVWNDTKEERVILLFDFDRPMRFWGRALHAVIVWLIMKTAYYQEPIKRMQDFEERFEAATRTTKTH